MKRLILVVLAGLAACASSEGSRLSTNDAIGPWQVRHLAEPGISVSLPCDPTSSTSTPQDGYGHTVHEIELRCVKPLGGQDRAFFRVVRETFPSDPALARSDFEHYLSVVRVKPATGPTLQIAGQQRETHVDYVLKQNKVGGDLGFHDLGDSCMWNFVGLDGETGVQAIMSLPQAMCPKGNEPIVTNVASKYFDSILLDAR